MNKVGEVGIVGRICKVRVASVWNDMGWRETEWKLTQCTRNVLILCLYLCIYVPFLYDLCTYFLRYLCAYDCLCNDVLKRSVMQRNAT